MTRFLPFGSRSKTIQVNTLGAGGAPAVTYATWNPADKGTRAVLSNGDLTLQPSLGWWAGARTTISKSSGKWYWEFVPNGVAGGGVTIGAGNTSATLEDYLGIDAGGWSLYGGGTKIHNNVQTPWYSSVINSWDTIGVLMNMDAWEISVRVNNVDTWVMFSGLTGNIFAMYNGLNNVGVSNGWVANFGATPFAYSVPSGYNAGLYT